MKADIFDPGLIESRTIGTPQVVYVNLGVGLAMEDEICHKCPDLRFLPEKMGCRLVERNGPFLPVLGTKDGDGLSKKINSRPLHSSVSSSRKQFSLASDAQYIGRILRCVRLY